MRSILRFAPRSRPAPASRGWCAAVLFAAACGGGGDGGPAVARAPSSSGDVWVVHAEGSRTSPPAAALAAFVNGLHVMVVDGNTAYAGMTRLEARAAEGGAPALTLANGLRAEFSRTGDSAQLRFSSGEVLSLRRQTAKSPE